MEQGDPFRDIRLLKSRIIIGLFLLMGIILSNGYKNTNVYNLILPRSPVLYEKFMELIKDNFKIYIGTFTRSLSFTKGLPWNSETKYYGAYVPHVATFDTDYYRFRGKSILWSERSKFDNATKMKPVKLLHFVVLNSSLFDQDKINRMIIKLAGNVSENEFQNEIILSNKFALMEQNELKQLLWKCNKTALLLPTRMAYEYANELKTSLSKMSNVGSETYYDTNIGFRVLGLVNKNIIRRIESIKGSGIVERWMNLYRSLVPMNDDSRMGKDMDQEPSPARLDGNIVVIFALLGLGLVFACVAFLCEVCYLIVRFLFRKFQEFWNRVHVLYL